jgi:acyl-coenzyme A thioesterase PaaI-like protein
MKHKVLKKQSISRMCLVCGIENKLGLHASFYELDNHELVAIYKPADEHQSYPERLHGGISATILDETLGRAISIDEETVWGVTVELNLKYKKPVPLDQELKVVAKITRNASRMFEGEGKIILANGDIAVTATGKYMKMSLDKIAEVNDEDVAWNIVETENDKIEIEY